MQGHVWIKNGKWYGRWVQRDRQPDGTFLTYNKSITLGTVAEIAGEKAARLLLQDHLIKLPIEQTQKIGNKGVIYFIQGEKTGLIKIGFSQNDARHRMKNLQIGSPDKLTFIGQLPGTRKVEKTIQTFLKDTNSHGEWFEPSDDLLAFIGLWNCPEAERREIIAQLRGQSVQTKRTEAVQIC